MVWTIFYRGTSKFFSLTVFEEPDFGCSLNEEQEGPL